MIVKLFPPEEIIEATVARLPLSKSLAARVMILHALTRDARPLDIERLPACDDTQVMAVALAQGCGNIDLADCGTAARFLTAYFASKEGCEVTLCGSDRLQQRPVGPLVEALRSMGAEIVYNGTPGCLPLKIKGHRLAGGYVRLDASESSQFASALAMVAPVMAAPVTIDLGGEIASMPYLKMTLEMLAARGVEYNREGYVIKVDNAPLKDIPMETEPDWSAAAVWYELAAVTAGWFTLPSLRPDSLQGDSILATIGDRFGVVTEFTAEGTELSSTPDLYSRLDMNLADYPDIVPYIVVTGCLINVPFRITGVANLRLKESDRLQCLADQLRGCGWLIETGDDYIEWEHEVIPVAGIPRLDACGDHRLAMAFAAMAAFVPGLEIDGAETVNKSYPGFWEDLRDTGFVVEYIDMEESSAADE